MIQNKKKGVLSYMVALLLFGVLSAIMIMLAYFFFAVGNDYIVLPLYNNVSGQFNQTAELQAGYESIVTNYQNFNLQFIDDMWFFGYLIVSVIGFIGAYSTRTTNYFQWLSLLTYGLMFMLFVAGLFYVAINWLYSAILLNLFDNLAVNLPKFALYLRNFGFIFLLQSAAMLLINMVDFDINFISSRKKKEQTTLSDDEII